jgi:hypothetical protein
MSAHNTSARRQSLATTMHKISQTMELSHTNALRNVRDIRLSQESAETTPQAENVEGSTTVASPVQLSTEKEERESGHPSLRNLSSPDQPMALSL